MHDTNQLIRCGLADEDLSPLFLGVFPADKLPIFFPLKNWIFIANTDPSGKPGKHWVAFGHKWNKDFFFDSYGKKPSYYQTIWARFDAWERDERDLQQLISDVCGDWCLYWCMAFVRVPTEHKLKIFMKKFSEYELEANDMHVFRVVHSRFPRILKSTKHFIKLDSLIEKRLRSFFYPECLLECQSCNARSIRR